MAQYIMESVSQKSLDAHTAQHAWPATDRISAVCPMCLSIIVNGTLILDEGNHAHTIAQENEKRAYEEWIRSLGIEVEIQTGAS